MSIRRVVVAVVAAGLFSTHARAGDAPALDGLDGFVERTMAEWKVPGLSLAVVKDGRVIHARGYGHRDLERRLPVTPRTLFAIGSISKSFTATGLSILADEGKLDWDRPVRDDLPGFRLKDRHAAEILTPRDLVTHRTGLPRHDLVWYRSGLSRPALLDAIRHLDANRDPRTAWQYNNLMFLAAGMLGERISGRSWEDYTRDRIFRPLGMTGSNFSIDDALKADDAALPYAKVGSEVRRVPPCGFDAMGPAGTINSSAEEMIRYVRLHLDRGMAGDVRVISTASADRMQTPQMVLSDADAGPLHASTFAELGHTSYGMAFFLTTYRGHKLAWHSGSIDGYSAMMAFLPRDGVGLIVLTNLSGNRPVPVCVARRVFDLTLGLDPTDWVARAKELDAKAARDRDEARAKAEASRKPPSSPSHPLPAYRGIYEHPAYGTIRIGLDNGRPTLSWRGETVPLRHRHLDVFEPDLDVDAIEGSIPQIRVTFLYNPDGDVDRLSMPAEPKVAEVVFAQRPGSAEGTADPYDVVLLGGRVVDGTGNPWFLGDVAIRGDRIDRVAPAGTLRGAPARRTVDATGMVIAPGFIDIQGHSRDELLTGDSRVVGKVTQGVTTEILGEGTTNAPSKTVKEFDGPHGFDAWLRAMERRGASINFGSFLGSGTVRSYAKGMAEGPPTPDELATMKRLVRDAMKDGAFGLASALIYPPDSFVATADLIALGREMAPLGGVYISHIRSEGDRLIEALDEAIRIGREAGVPVEVYHLKAAGKRNWDKARAAIAAIEAARANGQDVAADMYPYTAGSTSLSACLPPWASADGKLMENLADPAMRAKIRAEVLHPKGDWENLADLAGPEGVLVLGLKKPENRAHAGKRLADIAASMKKDPLDAAIDLILSERDRIDAVFFLMSEENVRLQLRQPWIKVGTDASGHDPAKPDGPVHPRSYGTYPRILGKYVRDEGVIPLEEAVRKMTSAVAARLSIRDRGLIREGLFADVVVFDLATIADRATFEDPHRASVGIRDVFVNGVAVVRDGGHTGAKPGRIVRGPGHAR